MTPPGGIVSVMENATTVVWWSAGAPSTVAAYLALETDPNTRVIYCDTRAEHEDNIRYRADVEDWLGVKIEVMASDEYHDPADVWERTGWIVGDGGARCTVELKKRLRQQVETEAAGPLVQVMGYSDDEQKRVARFRKANPDVDLRSMLVDKQLSKADCLGIVEQAGIEIPAMYRLGYRNNNCIGCPHGGMGYWNMIRRDFPDVFDEMADRERRFDNACCRPGGEPVFLDELDPDRGDIYTEPDIECSLFCAAVAT